MSKATSSEFNATTLDSASGVSSPDPHEYRLVHQDGPIVWTSSIMTLPMVLEFRENPGDHMGVALQRRLISYDWQDVQPSVDEKSIEDSE
jgi:hypothetical protein